MQETSIKNTKQNFNKQELSKKEILDKYHKYTREYWEKATDTKAQQINQEHVDRANKGVVFWNKWASEFIKDLKKAYPNIKEFNKAIAKYIIVNPIKDDFNYRGFIFPMATEFLAIDFTNDAIFIEAIFKERVNFNDINFNRRLNFTKAIFVKNVYFAKVSFNEKLDFSSTIFKGKVSFAYLTFNKETIFSNVTFNNQADFSHSSFKKEAIFTNAVFKNLTSFVNTKFEKEVNFQATKLYRNAELNFSGARFDDSVCFIDAKFDVFNKKNKRSKNNNLQINCQVDFRDTVFKQRPVIDNFKSDFFRGGTAGWLQSFIFLLATIIFAVGFNFLWEQFIFIALPILSIVGLSLYFYLPKKYNSKDDEAKFRALKVISETNSNYFKSAEFNACELNCERLNNQLKWYKKVPNTLFKLVSDYGLSLIKPLSLWFFSLVFFSLFQIIGFNLKNDTVFDPKATTVHSALCPTSVRLNKLPSDFINCSDKIHYIISPSVPNIFQDIYYLREIRYRVFGENSIVNNGILIARFFQSLFSYLALFLFALAIRSKFKI